MKLFIICLSIAISAILLAAIISFYDARKDALKFGYDPKNSISTFELSNISINSIEYRFYSGCWTYHKWHFLPFRKVDFTGTL